MSSPHTDSLRCTPATPCRFHADGAPTSERCPGYCAADGCTRAPAGDELCATHAVLAIDCPECGTGKGWDCMAGEHAFVCLARVEAALGGDHG